MVPNDLVALSGFGFRNLLRSSAFRVTTIACVDDTKNQAKTARYLFGNLFIVLYFIALCQSVNIFIPHQM